MNKVTKVTLSCDCGDPACLGEQTVMLFVVFGVDQETLEGAAQDFALANKLEQLAANEGAKIHQIRAEVDPALTCRDSIELVFTVLDAIRARDAIKNSVKDAVIEKIEWVPKELA